MGGGFSRQSLVDHAANYTFRPLRRKSDKSIIASNENNNDRGGVNIDSISSPRRSTSKDQTAGTMDQMSSAPPRRSTSNDHDLIITDSISSPRRSISNDRVTTHCTPSAKLLENNESGNNKDHHRQSDLNYSQTNISSPPRSISSPTITTPVAEIIVSKKETKDQSMNVINSDINITRKKDQDEDDRKVVIIPNYHEESDDDYGRRLSDYDGWVGSPSFREYCVNDYLKPDSNTCDGERIEIKTKGVNGGKEELTTPKKWRRIRKIKKAISMGNPSGMKNLLNVSACYSPANSAPHHKLVNQIDDKNG